MVDNDIMKDWNSEKYLEKTFTKEIESYGGLCIKLLSTVSGLPDRLVLEPEGRAFFVEFKSKAQKPRALQIYWHNKLIRLGFKVYIIDSKETYYESIKNISSL